MMTGKSWQKVKLCKAVYQFTTFGNILFPCRKKKLPENVHVATLQHVYIDSDRLSKTIVYVRIMGYSHIIARKKSARMSKFP